MKSPNGSSLESARVDVKVKLTALWATVLFLFAYGDILGFFRTGVIKDILAGRVSGVEISQTFLLATSVYIAIPSAMIFLSLVLRPSWNRWTNIVLSVAYVASVVLLTIGESWTYYVFLSAAETLVLLLIAWHAWRWPRLAA